MFIWTGTCTFALVGTWIDKRFGYSKIKDFVILDLFNVVMLRHTTIERCNNNIEIKPTTENVSAVSSKMFLISLGLYDRFVDT